MLMILVLFVFLYAIVVFLEGKVMSIKHHGMVVFSGNGTSQFILEYIDQ